jgi:hypothetical protein
MIMTEGLAFSHDFFRVDQRTHHLSCLDMATPEDGRKTAHDITVIKRRRKQGQALGCAIPTRTASLKCRP